MIDIFINIASGNRCCSAHVYGTHPAVFFGRIPIVVAGGVSLPLGLLPALPVRAPATVRSPENNRAVRFSSRRQINDESEEFHMEFNSKAVVPSDCLSCLSDVRRIYW